jgi:phytoene dehydrogenase-like protein
MAEIPQSDVIVIGSGPNGLAAAITMQQAGYSVCVLEGESSIGGSCKSAELTLPGFRHDICSAVFPLGIASPFFQSLPLEKYGLEWIHSPACLAHPLDNAAPALLWPGLEQTLENLTGEAGAYEKFISKFLPSSRQLFSEILAPIHVPRHPALLLRFGSQALRSAEALSKHFFSTDRGRAMFAGLAAHSMLRLDQSVSSATALVLSIAAHYKGWPIAKGGAQSITDALASYFRSLGGTILVDARVDSLRQLPPARAILADITPRELLRIAGDLLPQQFRHRLGKFRVGFAAYKVDWALDAPIPWSSPECSLAATVHLGGSFAEIADSERQVSSGGVAQRPFVLLSQPSLFDSSRAPIGGHTAWAYCHVPNGYEVSVEDLIENQVERFAPGFRKHILARSVLGPRALQRHNPNLVGGDISGGTVDLGQLFLRPTHRLYSTPITNVYLCSSSTPPGPGVHGMCGYFAAKTALRHLP